MTTEEERRREEEEARRTYEAVKQKVIEIVAEQLGISKDEVNPSQAFVEDLNADSLDLTELIMCLEEAFGCEITEKEAAQLKTVKDAIEYIHSRAI